MRKILVIQTAFIGDVVLATGLLEKLHERYPDAAIDMLLRKGNEGLLKDHPFVQEVLVWDKKQHKQRNLLRLIGVLRRRRYDLCVNVQRFAATGLLTALSGARETVGFDKNPFSIFFSRRVKHLIDPGGRPLHETERNQALISHLTEGPASRPRLYPSPADQQKVAGLQEQPYVTLSPASVWFTKQYPPEKWADLLRQLPPSLRVYLLGAPADQAMADEIIRQSQHPSALNLCGQLSFLQSAALMKQARMNYVNDSAPMHFASAVNAPVTAIYCSTLPSFGFGPLSDESHVVEILEPLDCRPCGLHGKKACPQQHFRCALGIETRQLLDCLPG